MKHATRNMNHGSKGFTLLEVLVASTIFILVIGVVVSVYLNVLKLQRQVVQSVQALDNGRLAFEAMSRLVRTGTAIDGPDGESTSISFTDQRGRNVSFSYDSTNQNIIGQIGSNPPFAMISSDIKVTRLLFIKEGTNPGDIRQPRATIVMSLAYTFNNKNNVTELQTTISQRTLDPGPPVPPEPTPAPTSPSIPTPTPTAVPTPGPTGTPLGPLSTPIPFPTPADTPGP